MSSGLRLATSTLTLEQIPLLRAERMMRASTAAAAKLSILWILSDSRYVACPQGQAIVLSILGVLVHGVCVLALSQTCSCSSKYLSTMV